MTRARLTLWDRVEIRGPMECWPYTGPLNKHGYGRFSKNGVRVYAHREAFVLAVGPIPDGTEVDHVRARGCMMRHCCNPGHLEAVTRSENMKRIPLVGVCLKGHSDYRTAKRGTRYCFPCSQESARATAARRKAGAPKLLKGMPGVKRGPKTSRYVDVMRSAEPSTATTCQGQTRH